MEVSNINDLLERIKGAPDNITIWGDALTHRIGDIADLKQLAADYERLVAWKESTLTIEQEWDVQVLAKILGGKLGDPCRKVIAEKVPLLIAERDKLLQEKNG